MNGSETWAGMRFVRVPEGDFLMGSAEDDPFAWGDEQPRHVVTIEHGYWIAHNPITNRQFGVFARTTGYVSSAEEKGWAYVFDPVTEQWERTDGASWRHPTGASGNANELPDHPVVSVSWFDSMAYCQWINATHGADLPDGIRFRLPTEAEWEKAARGTNGLIYPWGDRFETAFCNHAASTARATIPVGALPPESDSVYGAAGMSGNTWDWTTTLWGNDRNQERFVYPYDPADGREDLSAGGDCFRVIRGGSFKNDPQACRSACRDVDPPDWSLNNLGFRLVVGA